MSQKPDYRKVTLEGEWNGITNQYGMIGFEFNCGAAGRTCVLVHKATKGLRFEADGSSVAPAPGDSPPQARVSINEPPSLGMSAEITDQFPSRTLSVHQLVQFAEGEGMTGVRVKDAFGKALKATQVRAQIVDWIKKRATASTPEISTAE